MSKTEYSNCSEVAANQSGAMGNSVRFCGNGRSIFTTKRLTNSGRNKGLFFGTCTAVFAVLVSMLLFYGCKKDKNKDEDPIQGKATLRYETVPYSSKQKSNESYKLVCSASNGDTNYYVFLLGHVECVPLAYRQAVYYDGKTNLTIGYSASNVTQATISTSVTEAFGHSVSTNASISMTTKTEIGSDWLGAKLSYELGISIGMEEARTRSISNTYDVSYSKASETKDEITATIGSNNQSAGMYRYSLFSTTDVYYVVITDKAKTRIIEDYMVFCARPTQYWKIDYDPKEGGSFGKTASSELLQLPNIILSQLPNPDEDPVLPMLSTNAVTVFTSTTAAFGGNIVFAGTPAYAERGVCYATSPNPTIAENKTMIAGTGTGSFSTSISGLTPNTKYYVRAYATNTVGTAYGEQESFTTTPSGEPQLTYIDENGATQTLPYTSATRITSSTTGLSNGWYYVSEDDWITIASKITVSGNVRLILGNGSKLTVNGGINVPLSNKLIIYSQSISGNMGELTATGNNAGNNGSNSTTGASAGIGGSHAQDCGTIIINGGKITATGGNAGNGEGDKNLGGAGAGAGIGGGGGGGTKSAGNSAVGAGGNITINGGDVIAKGGNAGKGGNGYGAGGSGRGGGGAGAGIGGGGGKGRADGTTNGNGTYTAGGNGGVIAINSGTVTATGGNIGVKGSNGSSFLDGKGGSGGGGGAGIGGGGGGGTQDAINNGNGGENIGGGGTGGGGANGGNAANYTKTSGTVSATAGQ